MSNSRAVNITVNGEKRTVQTEPDTPLLWVLREELGLTGTKYGCGIGVCGACAVLIDGQPVRSCTIPVDNVAGQIETIEHVARGRAADLVEAWGRNNVPQCGYCQPGFVVTISALLEKETQLTADQLDQTVGNICRCGTYNRIRTAALEVAQARRRSK